MRYLLIILLLGQVAGMQVLSDDGGDVQSQVGGNADGSPAMGSRDAFDLLSLDVSESPSDFHFVLTFTSLLEEDQDNFDSANLFLDFRHEDRSYRANVYRRVTDGDPSYFGRLDRYDSAGSYYQPVSNIELDINSADHQLTIIVPRDDLQDANGAAPFLGRSLEDFRATVSMQSTLNFGQVTNNLMRIWDNMPDSGVGDTAYAVKEGVAQSGDARLYSPAPMRASNGDATTFLYDVTAFNDGDEETRFQLRALQVPNGWQVTLPGNEIRIPSHSNLTFKVLASVPFAHEHGGYDRFTLELRSMSDSASIGRTLLGVRYLEVPQPAGHHDVTYIHTRTQPVHTVNEVLIEGMGKGCLDTFLYVNTLLEDQFDEGADIPACNRNFYGTGTRFQWYGFLEPSLSMGMDWILNETGDVQIDFRSTVPLNNAVLTGSVVHIHPETVRENNQTFVRNVWTPVADLLPSTPQSIQDVTAMKTVLQARDNADLIPFVDGAQLLFDIRLDVAQPDPTIVKATSPVLTGGVMRLPLNEYQDLLSGGVSLSDLRLQYAGDAERYLNPGDTVLFNFTLQNDGPVDERVRLRVVGPQNQWATVSGETTVDVVSGRDRRVTVAVTAPASALDQDVAELILSVQSTRDASVQLTKPFAATVDTVKDYPDESQYVQSSTGKESPLPMVLLVLALWFVARRVK